MSKENKSGLDTMFEQQVIQGQKMESVDEAVLDYSDGEYSGLSESK